MISNSDSLFQILEKLLTNGAVIVAVLTVIFGIFMGFRSGVLSRIKLGSLSIEGGITPQDIVNFEKNTID